MEQSQYIKFQSQLATFQKHNSQPFLKGKEENYLKHLYNSNNFSLIETINQKGSSVDPAKAKRFIEQGYTEARSIIEKLMMTKEVSLPKLHPNGIIKSKKQSLNDTQEKIFKQIIGITFEIQELKDNIVMEEEQIEKLKIQNPKIIDQINYHGYTKRINAEQFEQYQRQNHQLMEKIDEIESNSIEKIEQVLQNEVQRYQQLKKTLENIEKEDQNSRVAVEKNQELRLKVSELQNMRKQQIQGHFPHIEELKEQNDILRQKTVKYLAQQEQESAQLNQEQEILEIKNYLHHEQISRGEFLEELRKFKQQYKRIIQENNQLKNIINSKSASSRSNFLKYENPSKQNIRTQNSVRKSKEMSQVSASRGQRKSKFDEFQNIIKAMRNANS